VVRDPRGEIVAGDEPLRAACDRLAVDEQHEQRDAPHVEPLDDERRVVLGFTVATARSSSRATLPRTGSMLAQIPQPSV